MSSPSECWDNPGIPNPDSESGAPSPLARDTLPDDPIVLRELPLTAGEKVDRRVRKRMIAGPERWDAA
jgi:hypothetical protein